MLRLGVLVDQSAENVAAVDCADCRSTDQGGWFGRVKRERAVGAFAVVMGGVGTWHSLEVAAAEQSVASREIRRGWCGRNAPCRRSPWGARMGVWITLWVPETPTRVPDLRVRCVIALVTGRVSGLVGWASAQESPPSGIVHDREVMTQARGAEDGAWPGGIAAITLFVEDLEEAKRFYQEVFQLPVVFEDDNSTVFKFGDTLVNLLKTSEAPELVKPATVATREAGVRFQFTLGVDDVDAMCEELKKRGVELLNGPMDRPWGIRTASFRDPGGHIWEIAQ